MKIKLGNNEPLTILNSQGGVVFQTFTANAVDLGLPSGMKWADRNIGAESPENAGLYFQWGDVEGVPINGGKLFNYDDYSLTHGSIIKERQEMPANIYFDAARKYYGFPWRLPDVDECLELINPSYTTITNETVNGISGCRITSKFNGNSIFLPKSGKIDNGDIMSGNIFCWTKIAEDNDTAYYLEGSSSSFFCDDYTDRYLGLTIRAVCQYS